MPFTPFHFGPGLLGKAIAARWFSLSAFIAAQVLIDCETLYHLVRHESPVHRGLHTFVGATLAGAVTALSLLGGRWLLRRVWPGLVDRWSASPRWRSEATPAGIWLGALVGGATHPLLDGLMHRDMRPFAPWSSANPLLGLVSYEAVHVGCVVAGFVGLVLVTLQLRKG